MPVRWHCRHLTCFALLAPSPVSLDPLLIAQLLVLGSISGFLAGLLGIGGSMLMVPVMTWVMARQGVPAGYVVHAAIGTSLATICVSSLSSVRAHHQRGAVRWAVVVALAPGILLGAFLGASLATHLDSRVLGMVFAFFLSFSAFQMIANLKPKAARQLPRTPGMLAAGGMIGTLSGLLGAGGGFISVPFMTWCNVSIHNAVATSAALGFPIAVAGTIGYVINGWATPGMPAGMFGFVYLPALLVIVLASSSTAPLGARAAHSLDTAALKRAFAFLLLLLAGYMLYRSLAR